MFYLYQCHWKLTSTGLMQKVQLEATRYTAPENRHQKEAFPRAWLWGPQELHLNGLVRISWHGCRGNLQPEKEPFCTLFEVHHLEYRSLINHIKINKLPALSPFGSLTTNLLMYAIYHQMEVPTTHLCVWCQQIWVSDEESSSLGHPYPQIII